MVDLPDIRGVKVLGRDEWRATADAPKPDVSFLPMMERRRLTALERAALHVAWNVFRAGEEERPPPSEVPVVFIVIGNPAEEFMVPQSRRLKAEDIVQKI